MINFSPIFPKHTYSFQKAWLNIICIHIIRRKAMMYGKKLCHKYNIHYKNHFDGRVLVLSLKINIFLEVKNNVSGIKVIFRIFRDFLNL